MTTEPETTGAEPPRYPPTAVAADEYPFDRIFETIDQLDGPAMRAFLRLVYDRYFQPSRRIDAVLDETDQ